MQLAGFDIETCGKQDAFALQPWRYRTEQAWITSFVGLSPTYEADTISRTKMKSEARAFLHHCKQEQYTIATWNGAFDIAWLIAMGLRKEVFECEWIDGMLLYRHLCQFPTFEMATHIRGRFSFGLKAAVARFLPQHAGYEDDVNYNPQTPEEWDKLRKYNRRDVDFTIQLTRHFWNTLNPAQRRVAYIESRALPMVADTIVRGLTVDVDHATQLSDKLDGEAAAAYMQLRLTCDKVSPEVLASPKQLANLLQSWGLAPVAHTATGAMSTDRDSLMLLADRDERAKLVSDYREAQNNKTKFADAVLDSAMYNTEYDIVHPQARIYGTYTGRMTYTSTQGKGKSTVQTGIALHQWKRGADFRKTVKAPEGYTLCEFDFAGQEFRWMGVMSKDPTMLSLCMPGEDAHSFMGASIAGAGYRDIIRRVHEGDKDAAGVRRLGKVANLSLQYRTSAARLQTIARIQHNLRITYDTAKEIHTTYRRTYREVPNYWRNQANLAKHGLHVSNLIGRQVQFLPPGQRDPTGNWNYEATAINYPIQSIGAEQKYLALLVARNLLPEWRAYFYFELHDGLFFIVPNELALGFVETMKHALSNLPYTKAWGVQLPIAFPVDAKYGPTWGELNEFVE